MPCDVGGEGIEVYEAPLHWPRLLYADAGEVKVRGLVEQGPSAISPDAYIHCQPIRVRAGAIIGLNPLHAVLQGAIPTRDDEGETQVVAEVLQAIHEGGDHQVATRLTARHLIKGEGGPAI